MAKALMALAVRQVVTLLLVAAVVALAETPVAEFMPMAGLAVLLAVVVALAVEVATHVVVLEARVLFVLSGPVQPVASHQRIQETCNA